MDLQIDDQLVDKLINFFQHSFKKPSKIITEINGTINSLVAGVLLQKALGEKAIALIIDFDTPRTETLTSLCKSQNLNTFILKRGTNYQKELAVYRLRKQEDIRDFYKRFVNYHLSIQADIMKGELVDTIDKSDRLMNQRPNCFYGSCMPFYSLYKTGVFKLAKFLKLPDLLSTDHDYWNKTDPILFLLTEEQLSPEEIAQKFNIDLDWLKKLKNRINKQTLTSPVTQFII